MLESWTEWMRGKHRPRGNTNLILNALETRWAASSTLQFGGMNQTQLAELIDEPEYVLRGMLDVLVDLHYVKMERRGNSKMYYII
jgi:hypothetical protein